MIRVLIADDHDVVRDGLRQIALDTADLRVTGEAASAAELLETMREQQFDVVVLDLTLPDRDGLDVLAQLRASYPSTPVVVLSMHRESAYAARVLRAGASAYINKGTAREHLAPAIRAAASGRRFLTATAAEAVAVESLDSKGQRHESLTDREFEVLRLIVAGKPPRQIAETLNISVRTVASHRINILRKLSVASNAELVHYAVAQGLSI